MTAAPVALVGLADLEAIPNQPTMCEPFSIAYLWQNTGAASVPVPDGMNGAIPFITLTPADFTNTPVFTKAANWTATLAPAGTNGDRFTKTEPVTSTDSHGNQTPGVDPGANSCITYQQYSLSILPSTPLNGGGLPTTIVVTNWTNGPWGFCTPGSDC
jgi:hypothetical protein